MNDPKIMADPIIYKIKVTATSEADDDDVLLVTKTLRITTDGWNGSAPPATDTITPVISSGAGSTSGTSANPSSRSWQIDGAPCILATNASNYYLSFDDSNSQSEIHIDTPSGGAASVALSDLNYTGADNCGG